MGGFFRPEVGSHADLDLWIRVTAYGSIVYTDRRTTMVSAIHNAAEAVFAQTPLAYD
jgi:hypothetical protein